MSIQNLPLPLSGKIKDDFEKEFLKRQEKRKKIKFREERRKKLEKFQEDELIKQIDIQYRMKKLISINKLYDRN